MGAGAALGTDGAELAGERQDFGEERKLIPWRWCYSRMSMQRGPHGAESNA